MQQTEALRAFSSACEWFLSSIAMNRPLAKEEAQIVEYYCQEILHQIAPSLQNLRQHLTTAPADKKTAGST